MSDHLIAEANRHAMALPTTQPTHADIAWYVREVSELRAELALLREDAIARAERAEAEVKKLTGFYNEIVVECGHDRIVREYRQRGELLRDEANRRKEAEAELAAERARLDWLESKCPILWSLADHATGPYWLLTDFPGYTEETASQHKTARAAIDAAMKEGA